MWIEKLKERTETSKLVGLFNFTHSLSIFGNFVPISRNFIVRIISFVLQCTDSLCKTKKIHTRQERRREIKIRVIFEFRPYAYSHAPSQLNSQIAENASCCCRFGEMMNLNWISHFYSQMRTEKETKNMKLIWVTQLDKKIRCKLNCGHNPRKYMWIWFNV